MNTLDDPNFRKMCYELNPKVKNLNCQTATGKLVEVVSWVTSVLEIMVVNMFYALTCDHWTSISGVSYLGATVHFTNDEFELVSFTLCCSVHTGEATAPDILKELIAAMDVLGLKPEFCVGVVTDTAPVMGLFGRLLTSTYGIPHMYCVDHSLEIITVCKSHNTYISVFILMLYKQLVTLLLIFLNYTVILGSGLRYRRCRRAHEEGSSLGGIL